MRRRRRMSLRKEKVIMLASSALVLTALTATGFYVRNLGKQEEEQYIDFADLEDGVLQDEELAQGGGQLHSLAGDQAGNAANGNEGETETERNAQNHLADSGELDYDPGFTEVTSGNVDNPGLTAVVEAGEGLAENQDSAGEDTQMAAGDDEVSLAAGEANEMADAGEGMSEQVAAGSEKNDPPVLTASAGASAEDEDANAVSALPALSFTEGDALVWPIVGNVLVNYSMDKTVYFATLQQYKYSPAIVISATAGEGIAAAADGKVTRIYTDPEIGTAVAMDLGDGYELTYGQLTDLTVSEGNYVTCGEIIGKAAEPTKYYSVEGTNVYFKLTKDGVPVNPLSRLG